MCLQHFNPPPLPLNIHVLANRLIAAHIVIGDIYDVNALVLTWGGTLGFEHGTGVVGKQTVCLRENGKLLQIARAVEWVFFDVPLNKKCHLSIYKTQRIIIDFK